MQASILKECLHILSSQILLYKNLVSRGVAGIDIDNAGHKVNLEKSIPGKWRGTVENAAA